ncbi:MAG: hypothetical protein ACMVO3_18505 [Thalassobaculum sp.]
MTRRRGKASARIRRRATIRRHLTIICSVSTYIFLPKLDYLPNGNRNLVIGIAWRRRQATTWTPRPRSPELLETATRPIWDENAERTSRPKPAHRPSGASSSSPSAPTPSSAPPRPR